MRTIQLTLEEGSPTVDVTIKHTDGIIKKKINHYQLSELLNISTSDDYRTIGHLPDGYVNGQIGKLGDFKCIVSYKGKRLLFNYYDIEYLIPFPSCVFYFKCKNQKLISSKVFTFKTKSILKTSKLYTYPFGNVYSNGDICWGGNLLPNLTTLKDIDDVVRLFFCSKTNNDLYNINNTKLKKSQDKLIKYLVGKKIFPTDILVLNSYAKNIEELQQRLLEEVE
ncbi:hypothetical protein [Vallitalea guaymasensis]|uniref:hypothetical protein n=1 Tax=Vallitalea guaymasensis TaxID=1185412 RepID=UPI00187D46B7|nr:hypothetical protein [Vallitalea guaymasensis]